MIISARVAPAVYLPAASGPGRLENNTHVESDGGLRRGRQGELCAKLLETNIAWANEDVVTAQHARRYEIIRLVFFSFLVSGISGHRVFFAKKKNK